MSKCKDKGVTKTISQNCRLKKKEKKKEKQAAKTQLIKAKTGGKVFPPILINCSNNSPQADYRSELWHLIC